MDVTLLFFGKVCYVEIRRLGITLGGQSNWEQSHLFKVLLVSFVYSPSRPSGFPIVPAFASRNHHIATDPNGDRFVPHHITQIQTNDE